MRGVVLLMRNFQGDLTFLKLALPLAPGIFVNDLKILEIVEALERAQGLSIQDLAASWTS